MHTLVRDDVILRTLRNGDTATVAALFARLGEESRRRRFCGPKPRLSDAELAQLARVDASHHALVAYVDGDERPVGIARLARTGDAAEIAFAVADECQGRGVGRVLVRELTVLARAAGIRELTAVLCGGNPPALALVQGLAEVRSKRWSGGDIELVVGL